MYRSQKYSGLIPPVPSSASQDNGIGRRLLTLIRSLEKNDNDDLYSALQESVESLQNLVASCQRSGILEGNVDIAEKVLASVSSSSASGAIIINNNNINNNNTTGRSRQSKKGRRDRSMTSELSIYQSIDGDDSKQQVTTLDVNCLISAVLRILTGGEQDKSHQPYWVENRRLLVILASDLITAAGEFVLQPKGKNNNCARAEYELLAMSGKQLLSGLERTMQELLSQIGKSKGLYTTCSDHGEHTFALVSCFRAASMLVSLFGTRLSRSTSILSSLGTVAWDALAVLDERVVHSAAVLLSSLPLAGGKDVSSSPSELWNICLRDAVASLHTTLRTVEPITSNNRSSTNQEGEANSNITTASVQAVIGDWMESIRTVDAEESRVDLFLQLIHGLTTILVCLLDGSAPLSTLSAHATPVFSAEVDVSTIIDLVETMLSFSVASETVYHGTKKRLRREALDNGFLSSAVLAGEVANIVKFHGLVVFGSLLESVGGPNLLPFAERIKRISSACLLSSSSTSLRKALDPSSSMMRFDGKRKRWLHTSIRLRAEAIRSFEKCILLFGVDQSSTSSGSAQPNETARSVPFIGGCIIELLVEACGDPSSDWGSSMERNDLVITAAKCLTACLVSGGEFLSESLRALVESVANVCLLAIVEDNPVALVSTVKVAFISLGAACLTTPWPDGAASSIADVLFVASHKCKEDPAATVVLVAASTLRVCEMASTSRVPALRVVTRSASYAATHQLLSLDTLLDKLVDARTDVRSRIAEAESLRKSKENSTEKSEQEKPQSNADRAADNQEVARPPATKPVSSDRYMDVDPADNEIAAVSTAEPQDEKEGREQSENLDATDNGTSEIVRDGKAGAKVAQELENNDDDDDDDDFPMIVDCGPDQGDEESGGE